MILIQAFITALLSGVFSGGVMFALSERRERNTHHLSKIEDCVSKYARWVERLSHWPNSHFDLFMADRGTARENIGAEWNEIYSMYIEARLLQEIYLPNESDAFSNVVRAYGDIFELSRQLKEASIAGPQMPDNCREMLAAYSNAIIEQSAVGKRSLYDAARRYAHAPFLIRLPSRKKAC